MKIERFARGDAVATMPGALLDLHVTTCASARCNDMWTYFPAMVAVVLLVMSVGWRRSEVPQGADPFGIGLLSDAWLAEHRRETESHNQM